MSAARRKGTAAESAVVAWLREHGFPFAERRALAGAHDLGDVTGIPSVVIEVKNHNRLELAEWVDQVIAETANAAAVIGAVIHKRKGKGDVGQWYATMPASVFAELLQVWTEAR